MPGRLKASPCRTPTALPCRLPSACRPLVAQQRQQQLVVAAAGDQHRIAQDPVPPKLDPGIDVPDPGQQDEAGEAVPGADDQQLLVGRGQRGGEAGARRLGDERPGPSSTSRASWGASVYGSRS
jgi:hypothetical protein